MAFPLSAPVSGRIVGLISQVVLKALGRQSLKAGWKHKLRTSGNQSKGSSNAVWTQQKSHSASLAIAKRLLLSGFVGDD